MVRLSRAVRFAINPPASGEAGDRAPGAVRNGFAGHPSMRGLGRHYEMVVCCRGKVDPATGYFVNIADIDRAVRSAVIPRIERACDQTPEAEPAALLPDLARAANDALGGSLASLEWRLSPTYTVTLETGDMKRATIRQRFEFAASHRLHVATMSDEENRAVFGKCNNPSGHGHNYHVEPAVSVPVGGSAFGLRDLERLTDERIIRRFDHMHLNTDVPEFAERGANPSVENIARTCFDLLAPAVKEASGGEAELRSVTVWETEKTSCVYPG